MTTTTHPERVKAKADIARAALRPNIEETHA